MSAELFAGDKTMRWNTPDFEEINLSGEVTAYANTDDQVRAAESRLAPVEQAAADPDVET
jgi:coenzyme PQQ precursor peptide PqqA